MIFYFKTQRDAISRRTFSDGVFRPLVMPDHLHTRQVQYPWRDIPSEVGLRSASISLGHILTLAGTTSSVYLQLLAADVHVCSAIVKVNFCEFDQTTAAVSRLHVN